MPKQQANLEPYINPFKVLIDSAEQQPFSFHGLTADADHQYRPLVVNYEFITLGRHPHGLGDYSIEGYVGRCHVERKSMEDCHSTVMGWEETNGVSRRDRFKSELENLSKIDAAMVVVEASLEMCLSKIPEWGIKPAHENRKIFNRTVIGMLQDYKVPWLFCDTRRLAEVETFLFLQRFWRKDQEKIRAAAKEMKRQRMLDDGGAL